MRLTQWLYDQEEAWRYLVYQGDADWSTWSARCVRQTDEVVVVADAASEPRLHEVAARLSGARQRWSLVLLHPAAGSTQGYLRWLRHADDGLDLSRQARPAG